MCEAPIAWFRPFRNRFEHSGLGEFSARFARDERGVTAILYGVMFTALLLGAAAAIDYGRAVHDKFEQQSALDAATLAASHRLGLDDQDATGLIKANKFFAANMPDGSTAHITSLTMDSVNGEVHATSSNSVGTTLLKMSSAGEARRDHINVGTSSRVVKGDGTLEVALVLDNSGSMNSDMPDLKTAAKNLVSVVFTGASSDKVKVGVVPFSASVNVGASHAGASWMDTGAASSIHSEDFSASKSRFDLFTDLGVTWGGCVAARPSPYDVQDTAASTGIPDTMFVPMFAPDEPDDANASAAGYSSYPNNYISDYGGTCPAATQVCVKFNKKKNTCSQYGNATMPVAEAQSRLCKYSGATVSGSGPNHMCTTTAILPLTQTKATVNTAIDAMAATGYTNIPDGTMWGWRVLSPGEPFSEGRAYSDSDNKKILVIMTDGDNTYPHSSNHNESRYGAFGFASHGRLGTTYTNTAYSAAMDTKLLAACANAKAANVTIYTVGFRLEGNAAALTRLQTCASGVSHAFSASSGAALIQSFENIGRSIAKLRVAG